MKRALAIGVFSFSMAVTGCANSLLDSRAEAPQVYRLTAAPAAPGGGSLPAALSVARPRAVSSLDTNRIAVVSGAGAFDYFAGLRWSEPAPQMLQRVLVEALAADGRFATTVAAPTRVPAEYLLDVELREFTAFYAAADAPPRVRVQWQVTLVDPHAGRRIASFLTEGTATAAAQRRDALVAAFQQASQSAVNDTVAGIRAATAGLSR